ncbi:MAG: hypothetical protein GWO07_12950 [Candidatus Dadabacteria bacterium]|nr:hypothetical protein [Candidatus Dadabacteria bacterium]NIV40824.1 hypothetical protein [Candidatus Dadabacteria bacterium]
MSELEAGNETPQEPSTQIVVQSLMFIALIISVFIVPNTIVRNVVTFPPIIGLYFKLDF